MAKRKPFEPKAAEEETLSGIAEAESLESPLTVNGKPVPPEFAQVIPYRMTDQGQAEAAAVDAKVKPSRVEVTSDAWDKTLQRKAEVWDFDPLREAVDAVREPGKTYRFISDRVLKRRGRRGWEPVAGKDGKPVEVADMKLGTMPVEAAEQRNLHYQEIGNDALATAAQEYELEQAKLIRDAKVRGLAPLRVGDVVSDNHAHPGMVTSVGLHLQRGEGADAA